MALRYCRNCRNWPSCSNGIPRYSRNGGVYRAHRDTQCQWNQHIWLGTMWIHLLVVGGAEYWDCKNPGYFFNVPKSCYLFFVTQMWFMKGPGLSYCPAWDLSIFPSKEVPVSSSHRDQDGDGQTFRASTFEPNIHTVPQGVGLTARHGPSTRHVRILYESDGRQHTPRNSCQHPGQLHLRSSDRCPLWCWSWRFKPWDPMDDPYTNQTVI